MPPKWDRVSASVRRAHDDFDFREVEVYNYTSTYNSDTGDRDYTRELAGTLAAEVREPTAPRENTTSGGTESEVDAEIRPRDDHGLEIVPAGESDKPTEVEDTAGDGTYEITEVFVENNGVEKWNAVEV
jgi:hypothetical protein